MTEPGKSLPPSLSIRTVDADDETALDRLSELHMELLSFGPMAALGARFIRDACYRIQIRDGLLQAALCEVNGEPVGFVAYTSQSVSFHRSLLRNHPVFAAKQVLASLLRDPRRVFAVARAGLVVRSRRGELGRLRDPIGEVISLAVKPAYLTRAFRASSGTWLSEHLVRYAMSRIARTGAREVRMLVDENNPAPLLVYHLMGARFERYELGGRPTTEVWFDLDRDREPPADEPALSGGWIDEHRHDRNGGKEARGTWKLYWEELEFDPVVFRIEAEDYVARLLAMEGDLEGRTVLDYGCGFGLIAGRLAPHVAKLFIWDRAENMCNRARTNVAEHDNVEMLEQMWLADPTDAPRFDLVIVNSVAQYMGREDFEAALALWKGLLHENGRIIVSDLPILATKTVTEITEMIRFCISKGVLLHSIWRRVPKLTSYFRHRKVRPLTRYSREYLYSVSSRVGLDLEFARANLTFRKGRLTAVFRNR